MPVFFFKRSVDWEQAVLVYTVMFIHKCTTVTLHYFIISRVCHAAQENGACANYVSILTGTTKSRYSRIHNSVVFYLINSKVAVEVPAYQRGLHTIFEENHVKRFRDMSEQTFKFFSSSFRTLEKIAVTHKLVLQSS